MVFLCYKQSYSIPEDLLQVYPNQKFILGSFLSKKNSYKSSMVREPLTSLLQPGGLLQTFQTVSSKKPFTSLLQPEDLLQSFQTVSFRSSLIKRPLASLLWLEDLLQVFSGQRTSFMSSLTFQMTRYRFFLVIRPLMTKRPFSRLFWLLTGLFRSKDALQVFRGQRTCNRSSLLKRPLSDLLRPEDPLKVFPNQKCPLGSSLCRRHLTSLLRPGTFYRTSPNRRPLTGLLQSEDLFLVFCDQKALYCYYPARWPLSVLL